MFEASEALQNMKGMKKIESMSLHQYSWNSEIETTWIILIGWHHKTSTVKRVYLDSETAIIHFQFTISLCNLCPAGFAKLRFEYWNNGQWFQRLSIHWSTFWCLIYEGALINGWGGYLDFFLHNKKQKAEWKLFQFMDDHVSWTWIRIWNHEGEYSG